MWLPRRVATCKTQKGVKGKQKMRYFFCSFYLVGIIEIQAAKMRPPLGTFIPENILLIDVNMLLDSDKTPLLATLESFLVVARVNGAFEYDEFESCTHLSNNMDPIVAAVEEYGLVLNVMGYCGQRQYSASLVVQQNFCLSSVPCT